MKDKSSAVAVVLALIFVAFVVALAMGGAFAIGQVVDWWDDGTHVAQRSGGNFTSGNGVRITSADNPANQRVDFTAALIEGVPATFVVCAVDAVDTTACDYNADGTNDELTLQQALDACPAARGCEIRLSEGNFTIGEPPGQTNARLVLIESGQRLIGTGATSTVLTFAADSTPDSDRYLFGVQGASDFAIIDWSIEDMQIVAQDAQDHGLWVSGAERGLLRNLYIRHSGFETSVDEAVQFWGGDTSGDGIRNIWIENLMLEGFGAANMEIGSDSSANLVSDIFISGMVSRNSGGSGLFIRCTGNALTGPFLGVTRVFVSDSHFTSNANRGVNVDCDGNVLSRISADANTQNGVRFTTDSSFNLLVESFLVANNNEGLYALGASNTVITTTFRNNGQVGAGNAGAGVRVEGNGNVFRDNLSYDDQAVHTQKYGFREVSNPSGNVYSSNYAAGNLTAQFSFGTNYDAVRSQFNNDLANDFTVMDQKELRLREAVANGTNYFAFKDIASRAANYTVTLNLTGNCSALVNGGALTINGSNEVVCSDDDGGAGGGGDSVSVNGAAATDANLIDGDIDWTLNVAPAPDEISATVACSDCVALGAETTGNYVATVAAPAAGITVSGSGSESAAVVLALVNDLAAIEGLACTGLVARTGSETFTCRTLTGPAAGITVTNGDGVSGNPTLALANDLAALENFGGTGLVVRTATDTWAAFPDIGRPSQGGTVHLSVPGVAMSSRSTLVVTANRIQYEPFFVFDDITIDQLSFEVTAGAASTTCRLGIYQMDANFMPQTLVVDAGTVDASSAAVKTLSVSVTLTAAQGRYAGAWVCNGAPTVRNTLGSYIYTPVRSALGGSLFFGDFRNGSGAGEHTALSNPALGWDAIGVSNSVTQYSLFYRISTP